MGIQGLLPFLKKASRPAHLRDFRGQTAAVDAYCWLHKGAFSCADKLVRGEPTDGYVIYVMKQVNLLINNGIRPILVFDGCHLPSKAVTETKRRENRERNKKKAKELLREGKTREARECFQRCVDVTSGMALDVINACRARSVDIIVAPYEADAQLAYLNHSGIAQLVITEDSDLVVFGCNYVLFKMDNNGGCVLVEKDKLHLSMNLPRDKFCFTKFRNMCILSGCDYLPSLPGIGLGKASKFFTITSNTDVYNVLSKLPSYLKMPQLEVSKEYRDGFIKALDTFLYQLVFDPKSRQLKPLTEYPIDCGPDDYPYAGKFVGHERALQIALGNINVQTGELVDNYDPQTYKAPKPKSSSWQKKGEVYINKTSIWGNNNGLNLTTSTPVKPSAKVPSILPSTFGKEVTVPAPLFKKRKSEVPEPDDNLIEGELSDLYSVPKKRQKKEEAEEEAQDTNGENLEKMEETESLDSDEEKGEGETIAFYQTSPQETKEISKTPSKSNSTPLSNTQGSNSAKDGQGQNTPISRSRFVYPSPNSKPPPKNTSQETEPPKKSNNPFDKISPQQTSKNPFAMSQNTKTQGNIKGKISSGSQFSALKRFNKMKRTVVDQNTIVQSRYFAPPMKAESRDNETENETTAAMEITNEKPIEELGEEGDILLDLKTIKESDNTNNFSDNNFSSTNSATEQASSKKKSKQASPKKKSKQASPKKSLNEPLSPVNSNRLSDNMNKINNSNSAQSKKGQVFKWGSLSERFAFNKNLDASKASKNAFKGVTPKSKEKENSEKFRSPVKSTNENNSEDKMEDSLKGSEDSTLTAEMRKSDSLNGTLRAEIESESSNIPHKRIEMQENITSEIENDSMNGTKSTNEYRENGSDKIGEYTENDTPNISEPYSKDTKNKSELTDEIIEMQDDSTIPQSQMSGLSDVCSVDNESFNLSQSSIMSSQGSQKSNKTDINTSVTSPSSSHSTNKKFGVGGKCKAPGLRKSASKKKPAFDPKQMNLRDMFSFKK